LEKAAVVPITALIAAVVAGIRRVRPVAVGQAVLLIVVCGILFCAKAAGERTYEDSHRHACNAGVICAGDPPPPR
jgi:hypothetical protein